MQLIFSDQPVPQHITKSIFLAGPSPRDLNTHDWRHEAVNYLESIGYDGAVLLPIPKDRFYGSADAAEWTYDGQIKWECEFRHLADIILFWVPRDIAGKMPAFTTNTEFGEDLNSHKIVYGRPDNAEKCRYLDTRFSELNQPFFNKLSDTLEYAINRNGEGSLRENGEVFVPLYIWNTEQFQNWYTNVKLAGNRLEKAKVLHSFVVGSGFVFSYVMWVSIWVEKEQRFKDNEFIFSRKDVSSVVAFYRPNDNINDTEVIIVKEFRSPVNNAEGMVYELPSGSSFSTMESYQKNAQHELEEETGLHIDDLNRFEYVGKKQLAATLSTHQSSVYKIELMANEYEQIKLSMQNKTVFGVDDTERTYVTLLKLSELKNSLLDFSTLGMIYNAVY